jgi:hypothetical protein
VVRSHASSLVANGADEAEILKAIAGDQALQADLPIALKGALDEQAPPNPEALLVAISTVVGLVGQNWTRAGRDEFMDLALQKLMQLPGALVLDALERACWRVTDGRFLVSWVGDDVIPKAAKLKLEIETLKRLTDLTV